MLGITKRRWIERIKPVLLQFFEVENGMLRQKRLRKERQYVEKRRVAYQERGAKGGRAKSLKTHDPAVAQAETAKPPSKRKNKTKKAHAQQKTSAKNEPKTGSFTSEVGGPNLLKTNSPPLAELPPNLYLESAYDVVTYTHEERDISLPGDLSLSSVAQVAQNPVSAPSPVRKAGADTKPKCVTCQGSGTKPDVDWSKINNVEEANCPTCLGTGETLPPGAMPDIPGFLQR